jgi:hypothetical protein
VAIVQDDSSGRFAQPWRPRRFENAHARPGIHNRLQFLAGFKAHLDAQKSSPPGFLSERSFWWKQRWAGMFGSEALAGNRADNRSDE